MKEAAGFGDCAVRRTDAEFGYQIEAAPEVMPCSGVDADEPPVCVCETLLHHGDFPVRERVRPESLEVLPPVGKGFHSGHSP